MSPALTALLPCYQEGGQVDAAYAAICTALQDVDDLEILIVDDGSTDDTLSRVKALATRDPRVRYLSFTRNFGLEAAFSAGFRYASAPWTVQLDADLQSPPEEVPRLLAKAAEGYDVVFGIRTDRDDPAWRRWGSRGQQWVAARLLGVELPRGASVFRVVRTSVARTVVDLRLGSPYFIATVPLVGARWATVPTAHRRRVGGRSRWRWSRLLGHSFELFFGYSRRPLTAVYAVAAAAAALALGVGAAVSTGAAGAATGSGVALVCSAVTLGALATTARYVHRLTTEGPRPRQYYIKEANVPVRPEDTLDGGVPPAPLPVPRPNPTSGVAVGA